MNYLKTKGRIFDIQRYSVHDGPGIRTIVFLKGCVLRCRWCCNPESQRIEPDVMYDQKKCVGCGKCLSVCPGNLLKKGEDGKVHIRNIRDCWGCTACLKECHMGAILYFLGADMGGMGSMLSVKEKGDVRIWRVDSPNGETKTIEINMKDSNKY